MKIEPIIVKEIRQADKVLEHYDARVLNPKICSDETLAKVQAMLAGVVEHGTARAIKSGDYRIAGKTGTAWKFKNGQYTRTYSTSFVGYFPADKPKYSCIVVVDSPKNGRIYGADVAAPVFKEVADKAMARDAASQRPLLARSAGSKARVPFVRAGQHDELALVCERLGVPLTSTAIAEDWVRTVAAPDPNAPALAVRAQPLPRGRVPNVQGMTLRDALFLLENRGLRVQAVGTGRVQRQSLAAGSALKRGATVVLELAPIGSRAEPLTPAPPATAAVVKLKAKAVTRSSASRPFAPVAQISPLARSAGREAELRVTNF